VAGRAWTDSDVQAFASDSKVGLLATLDPDGCPHVTLITTLQAKDPTHLTWGQFCEGKASATCAGTRARGFVS